METHPAIDRTSFEALPTTAQFIIVKVAQVPRPAGRVLCDGAGTHTFKDHAYFRLFAWTRSCIWAPEETSKSRLGEVMTASFDICEKMSIEVAVPPLEMA